MTLGQKVRDELGIMIVGTCDGCERTSSFMKEIRVLSIMKGFFSRNMAATKKVLCPNCRSKEFMYIDDDDIVRYNTVTKTSKGSVG